MWTAIINVFVHLWALIDVGVVTNTRDVVDVLTNFWTGAVVNSEGSIEVRLKRSIDVLAGAVVGPIVGVVLDSIIIVLLGVGDENVLSAAMTALKFTLWASLEDTLPFCWAALTCRSMTALDCARVLQTRMPSYHVWRSFVLLALLPQPLNQEPPGPQQLLLPDFAMVPHFGHAELMVVIVIVAGVLCVWALVKDTKRKVLLQSLLSVSKCTMR